MDIVLPAAVFCGLLFVCWWSRERGVYSYGHSSAQRVCDDCGQEQWAYCDSLHDDPYWEAVGEVKDSKCKCHKDAK